MVPDITLAPTKGEVLPETAAPAKANSVRTGLAWTLSSRIGTQLIQLGIGIALARLLEPAAFGTIGMLLVFCGFAQMLADSGLGSALIHKHEIDETDSSTVFWIQSGVGLVMTLCFLAAAGPMAHFFGNPEIKPLAQAMSCVFVLQALGLVHQTLLRRQFRFTYLAVTSIIGSVGSGLIAVVLAVMGYGVWALLAQVVLSTLFSTVTSWTGHRWIPRLVFSRVAARELGGYGAYLLAYSTLNYWLRNGDNLLIGRFLGSIDLGLYSRAYNLMLLPVNNIASVFGQVMFPALARLQHDLDAFRALFLRAVRLISFASFPIMIGIGLLSRQVTLILLGGKWAAMIPILQILSFAGLFQAAVNPVGWVYNALGRTREQFLLSVVLAVVFVVAMWAGLPHGLIGVTLGYGVWSVISTILNVWYVARVLDMTLFALVGTVGRIILATAIMGVAVAVADRLTIDSVPLIASAVICSIVGAIVYLAACWILKEPSLDTIRLPLVRLVHRQPRPA